jgi:hypothetical protein
VHLSLSSSSSFTTDTDSSSSAATATTQESSESASLAAFCTSVLYECLTQDKPEILQTYLSIYQTLQNRQLKESTLANDTLRNVQLMANFYEGKDSGMINPLFIERLTK